MKRMAGIVLSIAMLGMGALAGCGKADAPDSTATASSPSPSPTPVPSPTGTAMETEPAASPSGETSPAPEPSASSAEPFDFNAFADNASFGFAAAGGGKLLVADSGEALADEMALSYTVAVGNGGQRIPVRYIGKQEGESATWTSYQFDSVAGDVFEAPDGTAVENATYMLTNDVDFPVSVQVPLKTVERTELGEAERTGIADERGRAVDAGWVLAELGEEGVVALVQFERQGDDMLASLAVDAGEGAGWTYLDFPATYDETSTWRVDDGGVIDGSMFSLLLAARIPEGVALVVSWMGAEGESVLVVRQEGERLVDAGFGYSRYMVP